MRHLPACALLAVALLAPPFVEPASAVSVEDLVNLKANGLGDDVLVALVESDGSVFHLTPEDVLTLYRLGLGERVILAMIRTSRRPVAVPADVVPRAEPQPAPQVVTVHQTVVQRVKVVSEPETVFVPVAVPVPVREEKPPPSPVYWGFGGERRPDSWAPAQPARRR